MTWHRITSHLESLHHLSLFFSIALCLSFRCRLVATDRADNVRWVGQAVRIGCHRDSYCAVAIPPAPSASPQTRTRTHPAVLVAENSQIKHPGPLVDCGSRCEACGSPDGALSRFVHVSLLGCNPQPTANIRTARHFGPQLAPRLRCLRRFLTSLNPLAPGWLNEYLAWA